MNDTRIHTRINDGLLGPLERPTLKWLAVHSPKWMNPDIYTTIGIAGSAIAFIGYLLSRYHPVYLWMATLGFIVNWIGDSMDGTLARYRHIERPIYGYFIDHITDSITAVLLFLGMGLSPYVSFNVASLALVGFLLMSVLVYLRTYVDGEFKTLVCHAGANGGACVGRLAKYRHVLFWKAIMAFKHPSAR